MTRAQTYGIDIVLEGILGFEERPLLMRPSKENSRLPRFMGLLLVA